MGIKDDELWEELRYWLTHPITDEEQKRRDAEEKAYQEKVLNRVFGLDKPKGVATGAAAPVATPTQTYWDKNGNLYYTDSNGNKLPPQISLENIAKRAKAIATNASGWINETNPESQAYKEKINAILTLETLPLGTSAPLAKPVAQKLAPYMGRKMAQGVSQGLNSGAISGAVEGALRSYQEKENPLKTIPQDAALGATLGTATAGLGSVVGKYANQLKIQAIDSKIKQNGGDIKKLSPNERKEYFNLGKKYFSDYEQGVNTMADKIGNVKLNSNAINETMIQSPKHTKDVVDLSKNIRKAKYIASEPERHPHKKYDIEQFHRLRGDDVDYIIAENKKGNNYFYKVTDSNLSGPETQGLKPVTTIVPDNPPKLKSWSEWLEELKRRRGHK